jgi:hypothetical protein
VALALKWDREFESAFLQRRVSCEPDSFTPDLNSCSSTGRLYGLLAASLVPIILLTAHGRGTMRRIGRSLARAAGAWITACNTRGYDS